MVGGVSVWGGTEMGDGEEKRGEKKREGVEHTNAWFSLRSINLMLMNPIYQIFSPLICIIIRMPIHLNPFFLLFLTQRLCVYEPFCCTD